MLVSNEFLQTLQRIKVFQNSTQKTVKSLIEDSNKDKIIVPQSKVSIEDDVRLPRLDFVGNPAKLRAMSNGTLSIKKLEGDLFISVNVRDKTNTIEKMKEIASLFDFTRDFDIE